MMDEMNKEANKPEVNMNAEAGLLAVPLNALSVKGEDGSDIAPVEGDEVEVSVKGVVGKSDAGSIYIKPTSFNGMESEGGSLEPASEEGASEAPASESEMLGAYRAMSGGKQGEEVVE